MNLFKLILPVIVASTVLKAQTVCNGKTVMLTDDGICNDLPYQLVFEDDFDGNSLDTSKWEAMTGVVRDSEHKIAQQWYAKENIEISNGTLKLITKRDTLINQCYDIWIKNRMESFCEDFHFTAAQINSKKSFSHGKIEISCKLPKAKGVASSFWTFGGLANEIDIFEFENENNVFNKYDPDKLSRVHRMNSRTDFDQNYIIEDCPNSYNGPDFSASFHTFTLVWTPHKLEWYVDGKLKRVSTLFYSLLGQMVDCNGLNAHHLYVLNRSFPLSPMNIIIDNIIQVGKNAPDGSTPFPNYFEVDYVRFYAQQ